jgi:hypothetical protein
MNKRRIEIRKDNYYDSVTFRLVNFEDEVDRTFARLSGREKSEWLKITKVWNASYSPEITKLLAPTNDHMRSAAAKGEEYAGGSGPKGAMINEIKSKLRSLFPRGSLEFVNK